MFKYKRILVPLDGSELAERAVAPASIMANAMMARIIFLQVIEPVLLNVDAYQQMLIKERSNTRDYLKSVQSRFSSLPGDSKFKTVVGSTAAEAILNYIRRNDVDLVVMGSQGRSGFSRLKDGGVAEKVLREGSCDTMIIRAQASVDLFSHNRILVPLDGSLLADMSLVPAIAIAKAVSAALVLLRVMRPVYGTVGPVITLRKRHYAVEKRKRIGAETYLQQVQASLSEQTIPCQSVVVTSDTIAETIIDLASEQKADLIVMSTHGRSGLDRWIRGSMAEEVLRGANCGTLVIREQESIHKEDLVRMKGV